MFLNYVNIEINVNIMFNCWQYSLYMEYLSCLEVESINFMSCSSWIKYINL